MPDTLTETVHRVEAALKPRLRGVLHEAAFAVSLVTGTAIVCLTSGGQARVMGLDPTREPRRVKRRVGNLPDAVGFYALCLVN